jgi:hypothetical protein
LFQHEQLVVQLFEGMTGVFMAGLLAAVHEKGACCSEVLKIVAETGSRLAIVKHDP